MGAYSGDNAVNILLVIGMSLHTSELDLKVLFVCTYYNICMFVCPTIPYSREYKYRYFYLKIVQFPQV